MFSLFKRQTTSAQAERLDVKAGLQAAPGRSRGVGPVRRPAPGNRPDMVQGGGTIIQGGRCRDM